MQFLIKKFFSVILFTTLLILSTAKPAYALPPFPADLSVVYYNGTTLVLNECVTSLGSFCLASASDLQIIKSSSPFTAYTVSSFDFSTQTLTLTAPLPDGTYNFVTVGNFGNACGGDNCRSNEFTVIDGTFGSLPTVTPTPTPAVNQPPVISDIPDSVNMINSFFSFSGSFSDPDSVSWSATVDYGEGDGAQVLPLIGFDFAQSHTYRAAGTYTLTVQVYDNHGGIGIETASVTVGEPLYPEQPGFYNILDLTSTYVEVDETITPCIEGSALKTIVGHVDFLDIDYCLGNRAYFVSPLTTTGTYYLKLVFLDNPTGGFSNRVDFVGDPTPTPTSTPTPTNTPTPTPIPNVVPVVDTISATVNPVQVMTVTGATASFTDANISDTHTAVWDWGDGLTSLGDIVESNGSGTVSGSHVYLAAGVYEVTLTVTDNNNAGDVEVYQYLSVYNPTPQGLFNGVRKFTTPAGSYTANPSLSGQVLFGITSKYQGTDPTGDVSMSFNAAGFEFESTAITVLIVANGNEATLRGTGEVNGQSGYTFLVTGLDGGSGGGDFVRFQIKDAANNIVFDSQPGAGDTVDPTALITAGNVVIH